MWSATIDGRGLCLLILSLALAGCGRAEVLGPVSGRVTFKDAPVTKGFIVFTNLEKGVTIQAPLDEDGRYTVEMARGPGLPLGTYQVSVIPPLPEVTTSWPMAPPKLPSYANIPEKYRDTRTSELTVEVIAAGVVFDVAMKP